MTEYNENRDDDFIIVTDVRGARDIRIRFTSKTLADVRHEVASRLFPSALRRHPNSVPQIIHLVWCGRELKYGTPWHTGRLGDDEEVLMDEINPGVKNGMPMIHATLSGGVVEDEEPESEEEEEEEGTQIESC